MISSEVARTLVKSPPELWTELSDPAKLASHLCELGQVRITGTEPERMVEWRADAASGTVRLKPSGWGTKVTLTVTTELPTPDPSPQAAGELDSKDLSDAAAEPHPAADPEPTAEPQPEPVAPAEAHTHAGWKAGSEAALGSEAHAEPEADPEPEAAQQAHPDPPGATESGPEALVEQAPAPAEEPAGAGRRRGFFARLFARRRGVAGAVEAPPGQAGTPEQAESETPVAPAGAPVGLDPERGASERRAFDRSAGAILPEEVELARQPVAEPAPDASQTLATDAAEQDPDGAEQDPDGQVADISQELRRAEEVAAEHVHAVLTSVLDRLGAAHHRPFSRA